MKTVFTLMLCLFTVSCARHAPAPLLTARHCAPGSYPGEARYQGQVVTVCFVPEFNCTARGDSTCPVADVIPLGAPNTYLDPDGDEAAKDKGVKKHPWWKLWLKDKDDKDEND
jgi:hypothetical protein